MNLHKDLIIIDIETSGVDYEKSCIVQLGAVRFTKHGKLDRSQKFSIYIKPYKKSWSTKAEQIHGLSRGFLHRNGKDLKYVLSQFNDFCDGDEEIYLAHWASSFDSEFLKSAYNLCNLKYPFSYRVFDISSIIRFHLALGNNLPLKHIGETGCANQLGITVDKKRTHDGLYDAYLSGEMLEKVIDINKEIV